MARLIRKRDPSSESPPLELSSRAVVFRLGGAAQIVFSKRRIGADDQEIVTFIQPLMSRPCRKDRNVARFEFQHAAHSSAEPDRGMATGDSEHLMNTRAVVDVIVDSVAPGALPSVAMERGLRRQLRDPHQQRLSHWLARRGQCWVRRGKTPEPPLSER
jgi:hypothetical protein